MERQTKKNPTNEQCDMASMEGRTFKIKQIYASTDQQIFAHGVAILERAEGCVVTYTSF